MSLRFLLVWFSFFLMTATTASATGESITHKLVVHLDPENHRLSGTDRINLPGSVADRIAFFISPKAKIRRLTVNGHDADYRFSKGRVIVKDTVGDLTTPIELNVDYSAVFDDPFPTTPANTDNPGFGVTGIVGQKGTFILSNAGWYPLFSETASKLSLTVNAPAGIIAVTAGRSAGRKTENGRTLSFWEVNRPTKDLALSAAAFIVTESKVGKIDVATYFSAETQPLSGRYIEAVKRYLNLYQDLFGPYPFEKFAVVENFFPTGYGFASYTLMGGVVLRLPFIVDVSLGHEIAHCWWGNGVKVDYGSGNWSEGLTTYVADYLYQEKASAANALEYRRQWLYNYALLVNSKNDFPLSKFSSRTDHVTKVVGYDKSAMVFHMLRQILGEDVFWGALRDIFKEKLFQKVSWEDFRLAFERRAGHGPCCSLENFFTQWIDLAGAPIPALENVQRIKVKNGWQVSGSIVQRQDQLFDVPVSLAFATNQGTRTEIISLHAAKTPFSVKTPGRPSSVVLDPEANLFRRMFPQEIPASINTLKGADLPVVVVSQSAGSAGVETAKMLVRSLGLQHAKIIAETDFRPEEFIEHDRIHIGFPADPSLIPTLKKAATLSAHRFTIMGKPFSKPDDTFFAVVKNPARPAKVVGIFYPVHPRFGPLVARKAAHYGKYSYLAFSKGQNEAKGTWPVTDSPLIIRWE